MESKIALEKEAQTLLIPLYGRAMMSRAGKIIFDPYAQAAVEKLDFDFARLKIPQKLQVFMSIRGAILDDYTRRFLKENGDCLVIYLGCGLDARFFRVDDGAVRWYDLDFPEVIALKSKLYAGHDRYNLIGSSVTDGGWLDKIRPEDAARPVLILAEGLLMYLDEREVRELFLKLQAAFRECVFIFDAYSKTTARYAGHQNSLKATGARIKWGADGPGEIEGYGAGIKHMETLYFTDWPMRGLNAYYRFMFRLAGRFRAAREAHRIFVFHIEK